MAKQDDWVRLTVRLPPEVYARLTETVATGPNSMNAEIVSRLEFSFSAEEAKKREAVEFEETLLRTNYEIMRRQMEGAQDRLSQLIESLAQVEESMRKRGMRFDD